MAITTFVMAITTFVMAITTFVMAITTFVIAITTQVMLAHGAAELGWRLATLEPDMPRALRLSFMCADHPCGHVRRHVCGHAA